jgi:hypothetical protein
MKRLVPVVLLLLIAFHAVEPAFAARRVVVRRGPHVRTTVVVHRGWPLRRPLRKVVVRPARVAVRVRPATYLPVAVWTGVVVMAAASPARDVLAWEDAETLVRADDWTDITLNADSRGRRLWVQVAEGRVQFDWAEVVFANGDARVVEMKSWTRGPGLYELMDFRDGRRVDHVRMVARAWTPEARVVLRMEK